MKKKLARLIFLILVITVAIWIFYLNYKYRIHLADINQLDNYMRENVVFSDLSRGSYYCGDKNGKSYFIGKMDLFPDSVIDIPSSCLRIDDRMAYASDPGKWIGWMKFREKYNLSPYVSVGNSK